MITRIRDLDAAGMSLRQIAAAAGVSTFSVRNALGRVAPRPGGQPAVAGDAGGDGGQSSAAGGQDEAAGAQEERLPVLPDPVPREAERALAQ
jgi:hypothetical protein